MKHAITGSLANNLNTQLAPNIGASCFTEITYDEKAS
jgi:hypothetical protein